MNKTFLLLMVFLVSFSGCSKDDDSSEKSVQEIWLSGYTAFSSNSQYEHNSVNFLFFEANNGKEFKEEAHKFSGSISDYQSIKDDIFNLLLEEKALLKNGTIVKASKSVFSSGTKEGETIASLPVGRYYVVAIYQGDKNGYLWLYSNKYAAKYYEIKSQYNPPVLNVVFPCDKSRYGLIDWVSWNEKFNYEFNQ